MKSSPHPYVRRPGLVILAALAIFAFVPRRQPVGTAWSVGESPASVFTWPGFEGFATTEPARGKKTLVRLYRPSGTLGASWEVDRRLGAMVASRAKPGTLLASDLQGNVLALDASAKRFDPMTTVPGWPPKFADTYLHPSPLVADDESGSFAVQTSRLELRVQWSNGPTRTHKTKGPPSEIFFAGKYLFAVLGEGTVMRYADTGESVVFARGVRQAQPWGRSEVLLVSHDTRANWTYLTFADSANPDRKLKMVSPGIYRDFARLTDRTFASTWVPREIDGGRAALAGLEQGELRLCSIEDGELRTRCLRRGTYFGVSAMNGLLIAFDDASVEAVRIPRD